MFGFSKKKVDEKEIEQLKQAVQTGFNNVKQDVGKLSVWVKHLDTSDAQLKFNVSELQEELASVKNELEEMKSKLSIVGDRAVFKQRSTVFNKQAPVVGVLNSVQTGVQTAFLDNLSVTERAIIFVLLNTDMKLSYEDLAAMLGKRRATIRGQINTIKQKSEGLIEEIIGENSKKRVFIPDKIKEVLLKSKKIKNLKKQRDEEKDE